MATSWYLCSDGSVMYPLDVLFFLFPNEKNSNESVFCLSPKYYQIPYEFNLSWQPGLLRLEDLIDCMIGLTIMCIWLTIAFIVCKYIWDYIYPSFSSVTPAHKKWYVVGNMSKALFLGAIVFSPYYPTALQQAYNDEFTDQLVIKRSMVIYLATDVVALYMIPKLPQSTIIHHVTTMLASFLSFATNYNVKGFTGLLGFSKMIATYGALSSMSGLVNAYLALRVVYRNSKKMKILCYLSLVTYVFVCGINWTFQLSWLIGILKAFDHSIFSILYMATLVFIINDDIVLIKWLLKQSSPMAEVNTKQKKL